MSYYVIVGQALRDRLQRLALDHDVPLSFAGYSNGSTSAVFYSPFGGPASKLQDLVNSLPGMSLISVEIKRVE